MLQAELTHAFAAPETSYRPLTAADVILSTDTGSRTLTGNASSTIGDHLFGGLGDDSLVGGPGRDTAAYADGATAGIVLDLAAALATGAASLAAFRGLPKSGAYSASKAGMTAYFESVRLDVRNSGVTVTIIQPGFIKTPLTSGRASKMPFLMELDDATLRLEILHRFLVQHRLAGG